MFHNGQMLNFTRALPSPLTTVLLALLLSACAGEVQDFPDAAPTPDKGPAPFPDTFIADLGNREAAVVYACDTVDILFVIDNSNSMEQEQKNLAANFAKFIQRVEAIQPPIKSYHVGVISTDIGAGAFNDPILVGCKPKGDDGMLQHAATGSGCAKSYSKFLTGPRSGLAQDFACIAQLGLGGCGFEQQLESALRALTKQSYNTGFLRPNAPLAIIFITDEDDCSAKDTSLFNPKDNKLGPFPSRCVTHNSKLHLVSRYIDGFKKLKTNPDRVVVAAITGPAGQVDVDPTTGKVKPICSSAAFGDSHPGNRFNALIKGFGDRGVLESICQGDLAKPLDVIGKAIERACLK